MLSARPPSRLAPAHSAVPRIRQLLAGYPGGATGVQAEFDPMWENVDHLRLHPDVRDLSLPAGLDGERQDAILAVRGLRIQPEAFADDGPRMAWRVMDRLSSGPWLTSDDRALLEKAKDWASASPPDFLPDIKALRDRLLDALRKLV